MIPSLTSIPPLARVALGAGLFAAPALFGGPEKQRMAGQGPQGTQQGQMAVIDGELKAWMGPNFGWQSVRTYQGKTGKQPVGLEEFRKSAQYPQPEKAPGLDVPAAPALSSTNYPAQSEQVQQIVDPTEQAYVDLVRKSLDPKTRRELSDIDVENLIKLGQINFEQSMAKGVERTRREKELETLRQWGALQQTQIAANLTAQALVAQSMALAATPNVSVMDAMTKGTAVALAPFQFRLGVRGG